MRKRIVFHFTRRTRRIRRLDGYDYWLLDILFKGGRMILRQVFGFPEHLLRHKRV